MSGIRNSQETRSGPFAAPYFLYWMVGAFVAFGALCFLTPTIQAEEIQRVVVIEFDTTRLDDIGAYGSFVRTPNIDALAARGMRYLNAVTCVPYTTPSVATLMTGLYPKHHGVYALTQHLSTANVTLAEVLHENGFFTAGLTGNLLLSMVKAPGAPGISQGFDYYSGMQQLRAGSLMVKTNGSPKPDCEVLTDKAMDLLEKHRDDRFFLWMIYFEPHSPYSPAPPFDTLYLDEPSLLRASVPVDDAAAILVAPRKESIRDSHVFIARHKAEVSQADEQVGRLLRKIGELPGKTLIIFTADHGESLGDDGQWFRHGTNIRYPCVNIPFILQCDGVIPTGTSDALTSNADVMPTILGLLNISSEALAMDGQSLVPTFSEADPWPDRHVPLRSDFLLPARIMHRGIRTQHYVLHGVFDPQVGALESASLFDLRKDPKEQTDIARLFPEVYEQHMKALQILFEGTFPLPTEEEPTVFGKEEREQLRDLGYLE